MSSTVCPECGCRCGVLTLSAGCGLARRLPPADTPPALIDGRPASLENAIDRAADLLGNARYPLIHGLERLTCEAQRAAIELADHIGACVDFAGSGAGRLFPDIGTMASTLGEIKNRADLIVYWGLEPANAPLPIPEKSRREIVSPAAGSDFAALWLLRALVQGKRIDPAVESLGDLRIADWQALTARLKQCKYGVLLLPSEFPPRAAEAAHGLATDLNGFTRFHVLQLCERGNAVGAEQVLSWQTGFGCAVGLSAGYPRSFGDEYGTAWVLARSEVDAVLWLGEKSLPTSREAVPTVALSSQIASLPGPPSVAITTAACAVNRSATAFRFDGLALPLRPAISSSFPDDFQVLKGIEIAVRRRPRPADGIAARMH